MFPERGSREYFSHVNVTFMANNNARVVYNGSSQRHRGTVPATGFSAVDSFRLEMKVSNLRWSFGATQRLFYLDLGFRLFINSNSTTLTFASNRASDTTTTNITGISRTAMLIRAQWDRSAAEFRLEIWDADGTNQVAATTVTALSTTFDVSSQLLSIGAQTDDTNWSQAKVDWARWIMGTVALNSTPPADGDSSSLYEAWEFETNANGQQGSINLTAAGSPTYETWQIPSTASLALTGYAPSITASSGIIPGTKALTITTYSPNIVASSGGGGIGNSARVVYNGSTQRHRGTVPATGFSAIDSFRLEMKLSNLRWGFGATQRLFYLDLGFRLFINSNTSILTFASNRAGDSASTTIGGVVRTSMLVRAQWDRPTAEWRLEIWDWDGTNRVAATTVAALSSTFDVSNQLLSIGAQTDDTNWAQVKVGWARWIQGTVALNSSPPDDADSPTLYEGWEFETTANGSLGNINLVAAGSPIYEMWRIPSTTTFNLTTFTPNMVIPGSIIPASKALTLTTYAPNVIASGAVPTSYALISHREPILPPTLPNVSAGIGALILDPVFNTRIIRVTDATTQPNQNTDGPNGKGSHFHTSSASDHCCISLLGTKFYIMNVGGSTLVYQFNQSTFAVTPYPPTVNSPDYNDNTSGTPGIAGVGPRIIKLQNEPDFSFEDDDKIYGSKIGVASGHPTLASYTFSTDTYANVIDLSTLGYNLTPVGADYGSLLAYTSMANADNAGTYGTAHGEYACAMFGGNNADYAYLVAIIKVSDGSVVKLINTRQNTVGTNASNQVWMGSASASQTASTLNGALNATDTTIIMLSTTYLPKDGVVKIDNEFVTYTGTTATTITGCVRGARGSTAATHTSGTAVLTYGYDLHNATITRDGHYVEFTRANRTQPTPGVGNVWIWDIFGDAVTFESVDDSGHVVVGFDLLVNQNGRHDSVDYEVRFASTPNTGIYYTTPSSTGERYNVAVDGLSGSGNFAIADHTSWNNAKPTQRYAPVLSGNYRYYSGGNDPYDYTWRARAEWDDEIILIDPSPGSQDKYWRACQHRSKVRGDLKATGTAGISTGQSIVTGIGTTFLSQVAVGDKVNITSWDGASGGSIATGQQRIVTVVTDDTHFTVGVPFTSSGNGLSLLVANKGPGIATFYYTPRAVISQTGRYAIFTSMWEGTLGAPQSSDSSHGAFRNDVFLVELPTANPPTPVITTWSAATLTSTSELISFDTDVLGDTVVEYSTDVSYSSNKKDYILKTSGHSVTLTGLATNTTYNYRLKSRNQGVTSTAVTGSFVTGGAGLIPGTRALTLATFAPVLRTAVIPATVPLILTTFVPGGAMPVVPANAVLVITTFPPTIGTLQPGSIEITGSIVDYDGSTLRPGKRLYVFQSSQGSTVFDKRVQTYTFMANGQWSPKLIFRQGATIYLFLDSPKFDIDRYNGVKIVLPSSATATLGSLL